MAFPLYRIDACQKQEICTFNTTNKRAKAEDTYVAHTRWLYGVHVRTVIIVAAQNDAAAKWSHKTIQCVGMHVHCDSVSQYLKKQSPEKFTHFNRMHKAINAIH